MKPVEDPTADIGGITTPPARRKGGRPKGAKDGPEARQRRDRKLRYGHLSDDDLTWAHLMWVLDHLSDPELDPETLVGPRRALAYLRQLVQRPKAAENFLTKVTNEVARREALRQEAEEAVGDVERQLAVRAAEEFMRVSSDRYGVALQDYAAFSGPAGPPAVESRQPGTAAGHPGDVPAGPDLLG